MGRCVANDDAAVPPDLMALAPLVDVGVTPCFKV